MSLYIYCAEVAVFYTVPYSTGIVEIVSFFANVAFFLREPIAAPSRLLETR